MGTYPAGVGPPIYVERSALTRADPANVPTSPNTAKAPGDQGVGSPVVGDGIDLAQTKAVSVTIQANPNQTLSGGGALWCWILDQSLPTPAWARCPELDLSMAWPATNGVTATVKQTRVFPSLRIPVRGGNRLIYAPQSVTVSGGTDVLIKIVGFDGQYPS